MSCEHIHIFLQWWYIDVETLYYDRLLETNASEFMLKVEHEHNLRLKENVYS